MTRLVTPQKIWNIDNTENIAGRITHSIFLNITAHRKEKGMMFLVTNIGNEEILLGYPGLWNMNQSSVGNMQPSTKKCYWWSSGLSTCDGPSVKKPKPPKSK